MPFIHIQLGRELPPVARESLARRSTTLIAEILHKRLAVTAVRVDANPVACWTIAGQPVPAGQMPTHCAIYITAGTNSDPEKAAMIAALHRLLDEVAGGQPEASYIVIHEIAASSWGYDGRTQAARRPQAESL